MHGTSVANSETPSFWPSVREALRGSHQDFTSVSLDRAILLLAIPMVLEMVLESLFGVVDVFWVGRLGSNAVATVGLTESMLALVFAVAMGLVGSNYTRIALGGGGVVLMLFLNNAIFRGAGDAAIAMRLLWVSNIINLALDPCLIFGLGPFPKLGVTGAALATFTGRSIGVLYQFYRLLHGTERIRILRRQVRIELSVLLRLLRVSLTGILQFTIAHTSWIGLVRIISIFGATALAGYTIAIRLVVFFILPSWGLSNAAATLVGQNLGAKRSDRAEASVWRTGLYNMVFLGGVGVFFIVFAPAIVGLFSHDPDVVRIGGSCLRIVSCGNIAYAYGMVLLQAFNGAGDTLTPTFVNLFGFWMLEIPMAYWLAIPVGMHSNGAFISIVIGEAAMATASIFLFRKGRWKTQQI